MSNKNLKIDKAVRTDSVSAAVMLRRISLALLLGGIAWTSEANTINAAGNWDNTGIWSGANIADVITENVTMSNNLGTITVRNTFNYTVGSVDMGNGNTLTIANGGTLNVGASGSPKNFVTNNSTTINVNGTLIIWGDLQVNNNLVLVVTGTLIVKGNVQINNGGNLNISGSATINGDFQGGNNTALTVDGSVAVGGNVSVGNGSTIGGTGTMSVSGSCSDGGSTFCGTGPLPVKLLYFKSSLATGKVTLEWATASELNFDYFLLERSGDGKEFYELEKVQGHGTTNVQSNYSLTDPLPLSGLSYYRLTSVDFDGYQETFNVVSVHWNQDKLISLFPNPAVDQFSVQLNFQTEAPVDIQITSLSGIQVFHDSQFTTTGSIPISLNLKDGVYVVKVLCAGQQYISRLLIRKS